MGWLGLSWEETPLIPTLSQLHDKINSSLIFKNYIEITNFEERTGAQPPQLPPPSPATNPSDFFETSTMFFNPKRKLPFCSLFLVFLLYIIII